MFSEMPASEVGPQKGKTMSSIKSRMVGFCLAALLLPLFGCEGKSCEDLKKDVTNQCCAGKSNCTLDNEAAFDSMCKQVDDKCGTNLTCSGSPSGATCVIQCGCG
jgi:hypothetical protein